MSGLSRIARKLTYSALYRTTVKRLGDASSALTARLFYTWRLPATMADRDLYRPKFRPWLAKAWRETLRERDPNSFVALDAKYVLVRMLEQVDSSIDGDVAECGVYRGGTARIFAEVLRAKNSGRTLCLFDTFEGMPETDSSRDSHRAGDFDDTSERHVREYVARAGYDHVVIYPGFVPQTLLAVAQRTFAFVHIDLDIYRPILDASTFFYDRMERGAIIVYDDYAWPSCPGARQAVDEFYAGKPERPLVLATGQCLVIKS